MEKTVREGFGVLALERPDSGFDVPGSQLMGGSNGRTHVVAAIELNIQAGVEGVPLDGIDGQVRLVGKQLGRFLMVVVEHVPLHLVRDLHMAAIRFDHCAERCHGKGLAVRRYTFGQGCGDCRKRRESAEVDPLAVMQREGALLGIPPMKQFWFGVFQQGLLIKLNHLWAYAGGIGIVDVFKNSHLLRSFICVYQVRLPSQGNPKALQTVCCSSL